MIPEILPVSTPNPDVTSMALTLGNILGYNPSKSADRHKGVVTDPARFLSILSSFDPTDDRTMVEQLRRSANLQRFLHYGFLIVADQATILESIACTDLKHRMFTGVGGTSGAYVSGTLGEFKAAVMACCQLTVSPELRALYCRFHLFFETEGLKEIWAGTAKTSQPDKTYILRTL